MHTSDITTEFVYWQWDLHNLAPGLLFWMLEAGRPVEPVATQVLQVFRSYGRPAIQAALDNPGYPKDPAVRWARTFPKNPPGRCSTTRWRQQSGHERSWRRLWGGRTPIPAPSTLCSPDWKPTPPGDSPECRLVAALPGRRRTQPPGAASRRRRRRGRRSPLDRPLRSQARRPRDGHPGDLVGQGSPAPRRWLRSA